MTVTYIPLANTTTTSRVFSVTFSSISQSYRDLVLVITPASDSNSFFYLKMNGIGGSSYSDGSIVGDGSSTFLQQRLNTESIDLAQGIGGGAGAVSKVDIMDYSTTNKNKNVLWRTDRSGFGTLQGAGTLTTTAAITSVSIEQYTTSTFGVGSNFALYGIVG